MVTAMFVAASFFMVSAGILITTSQNANARESEPVTQKLWRGITKEDLEILKKVSVDIKKKNYNKALSYVKKREIFSKSRKPKLIDAARDVILWNKYSGSIDPKKTSFSDISRFAIDNPFYPNISTIKRNVEKVAISKAIPYKYSKKYFTSNPAGTTSSKLYLLKSKVSSFQRFRGSDKQRILLKQNIKHLISEIWAKENFSKKQKKEFLKLYQENLTRRDYERRIERLLWDGKVSQAKAIMDYASDDYQKLFKAIIKIQKSPKYIDQIIRSIPRKLRSNECLAYRKVLWYKGRDQINNLLKVMIELPGGSQYPDRWWSLRHLYAREMLKKKRYKKAYVLAAQNSLPADSSSFWEAQWISGWIALRFLDEPEDAYTHFENLYNNVSQPVTLARASYWLGMASLASGDKQKAIDWYKVAAKYPVFFYGQLAINKHRALDGINAKHDIILPKNPRITLSDMRSVSKSRAARVAYLLAVTGDKKNASKIFKYIVNHSKTEGQIAVIMKIINEIGDRRMDVKISRVAAKKNVFFIRDKFQIVKEVSGDEYAPLVHAIIKQESGFAPTAVSKVGALGFMQLMPSTAKMVAKDIGIRYNRRKLATNINYNVRLGTHYIKEMIDRFDGSEMLAIASYNAGPNATQRWINEFYDPREERDIDRVVDWVELITYSETRNYVQRIMENLIVYKYLMSRANYDSVR